MKPPLLTVSFLALAALLSGCCHKGNVEPNEAGGTITAESHSSFLGVWKGTLKDNTKVEHQVTLELRKTGTLIIRGFESRPIAGTWSSISEDTASFTFPDGNGSGINGQITILDKDSVISSVNMSQWVDHPTFTR